MSLANIYRAVAQDLTFTTNTISVGGEWSTTVVATDINGDGKLDLISANYSASSPYTLTVLTNNGFGVFGSNATLNVDDLPLSIAAADINSDGKVDLIIANSDLVGPSTLTVFTNNGNGLFGSNATVMVNGVADCVIPADVNGDGKMDLVVANFGNNTLMVFTNNGNGVFGSNATLNVGNGPLVVLAADINGNGKLDLVSANSDLGGPGTLSVFTNNGCGVFGSNATLNVGEHPVSVVAADLSGDGKMDLISVNIGDNTVTIWTNNGTGGFGSNESLSMPDGAVSVVAADMNGDGKADLICANSNTNALTVFTNNGSGGFGLNATLNVGYESSVIAADLTGDGKLDLVGASPFENTLTVLINTSISPAPISKPLLTINRQGDVARVSWPSASAGWSLQQNPDLTTTYWGPSGYSGYTIADDGTNKSLIIPPQPGNLYFRLLHP